MPFMTECPCAGTSISSPARQSIPWYRLDWLLKPDIVLMLFLQMSFPAAHPALAPEAKVPL